MCSCKTIPGVRRTGKRRRRHPAEAERGRGKHTAAVGRQHAHAQPWDTSGGGVHQGIDQHALLVFSNSAIRNINPPHPECPRPTSVRRHQHVGEGARLQRRAPRLHPVPRPTFLPAVYPSATPSFFKKKRMLLLLRLGRGGGGHLIARKDVLDGRAQTALLSSTLR